MKPELASSTENVRQRSATYSNYNNSGPQIPCLVELIRYLIFRYLKYFKEIKINQVPDF